MRRQLSEQRARARIAFHVSARIFYTPAPAGEQVGLIRDISVGGLFFYSEFEPRLHTPVRLVFSVPLAGRDITMFCEGSVVRVEPSRSKAIGVAVRMTNFDFLPSQAS